MTREEAIKVLKEDVRTINVPEVAMTLREWEEHDDHMRDALEIAIEALSAQVDGDLVSRQAAIDAVEAICNTPCNSYFADAIKRLPSADRPSGKWIKLDMHAHLADHKCTACGQECYVPTCMGEPMYTYCPNCGARMEGGGSE